MSNTKLDLRFAVAIAFIGSLANAMLAALPADAGDPPVISPAPVAIARPADSTTATPTDQPTSSVVRDSSERPCVLLRNENVLFGEARQFGEFVLIRTGEGGEIKLKRQEVLCWASSIRSLYQYRVDHRQKGDVSDLIADANWCIRYDLRDLAAREILAIRKLYPNNAVAKRLEEQLLREAAAERNAVQRQVPTNNDLDQLSPHVPVRIVGFEESDETSDTIDPRLLRRFASHIQPMLLNRCGNCHGAQNHDPSGWTLTIPGAGSRASARITRDNLTSTLDQLDIRDPKQSPLLVMATRAHGGSATPLDTRNAKAIAFLQNWIWAASKAMASEPGVASDPVVRNADSDLTGMSTPTTSQASSDETADAYATDNQSGSNQGPARLPMVANPFDPELFNRRFHPDSPTSE